MFLYLGSDEKFRWSCYGGKPACVDSGNGKPKRLGYANKALTSQQVLMSKALKEWTMNQIKVIYAVVIPNIEIEFQAHLEILANTCVTALSKPSPPKSSQLLQAFGNMAGKWCLPVGACSGSGTSSELEHISPNGNVVLAGFGIQNQRADVAYHACLEDAHL